VNFNIGDFVAAQLVRKLNKEPSEFELARAFIKK